MKILNGSELASFIKVRQLKQVRNLRQTHKIFPRLAIVRCDENNPVIDTYIRLKKKYAEDILIDVEVFNEDKNTVEKTLKDLSLNDNYQGIILQLPTSTPEKEEELIKLIPSNKDVDGLVKDSNFDPATPIAINWLINGYGIDLKSKKIAVVGKGRLVGAPLIKMWQNSGLNIKSFDKNNSEEMQKTLKNFDLIVSGTGVANLIKKDMISEKAIIVDAGTASENGVIVGDVSEEIRELKNITITPKIGGVGPLTISALFENLIQSYISQIKK